MLNVVSAATDCCHVWFAGISWVLKLLLRDVSPLPELVAHGCYLLSNLVVVEPKLQELAREQRAFEIISRYLQVRMHLHCVCMTV